MPEPARIAFAGGGTGGHLFPAVATAEALIRLRPDLQIEFFVTDRPIDGQILAPYGWRWIAQAVRPFSTRPWHWPSFWLCWRRAVREARQRLMRERPGVVVGTGGYAAGPPIHAAHELGIPTALLNPDLKPGRANRHLASKVEAVFCQWEGSARSFPHVPFVVATGCPVRGSFLGVDRASACDRLGLDPGKRTLLVTGASQGARTINEAMMELAGDLAGLQDRWQVLHLSGSLDHEQVRSAYAARLPGAVVLPFTEHMAEAVVASDLVVSRAGASTLAELTAVGRPSVLLPYPYHRDMHQAANAAVLAEAGAAIALEDRIEPKVNASQMRGPLIEAMGYPERLGRMAEAAKGLGRPDAAETVARRLIEMAGLA
ncbi:MAG: UDP-N-acetylglucosamine--N-acetylmuramyl-(pentapeptide) pyrophosphoryl-undecaprenol N-acetylglucosamine transferase [Phycisphaerae bacterium]|nr:UDP-N-acetylglucosamine--N-acetylmuramyl-(pentapeptide) pyrophosphoryl-undecaprenol N-acetylglucosamine transferase [Phycisphaerae bacterium]